MPAEGLAILLKTRAPPQSDKVEHALGAAMPILEKASGMVTNVYLPPRTKATHRWLSILRSACSRPRIKAG